MGQLSHPHEKFAAAARQKTFSRLNTFRYFLFTGDRSTALKIETRPCIFKSMHLEMLVKLAHRLDDRLDDAIKERRFILIVFVCQKTGVPDEVISVGRQML